MNEVRCPKCNRLLFTTVHKAKVVEVNSEIEIMCKCKRKLNITIKRL